MIVHSAKFRFYAELNDFLPREKRQSTFSYLFRGQPAVKDSIEAIGVPHTEVDLILVNGMSVDFRYRLQPDDRVAVYPVFECFDVSDVTHLRPRPLRQTRFVLDVHLGKLARYLRMLGFDTLYSNAYGDHEIVQISVRDRRLILTRDRGLLKHKLVTHGYWLRATDPTKQLREVLQHFDLFSQIRTFGRCMRCNGLLETVPKSLVLERIPTKARRYYEDFYRCATCGRIYWRGSHVQKMQRFIVALTGERSMTG